MTVTEEILTLAVNHEVKNVSFRRRAQTRRTRGLWRSQMHQRGSIDRCRMCYSRTLFAAFPVFRLAGGSVKLIRRWQGKCNYMSIQQHSKELVVMEEKTH